MNPIRNMVFSENSWQLPSKRPEKMPFFEWDWMYNRLISIGSRDTSARFWIPAVGPSMFRLVLLKWRSEAGLMWKLGIQKIWWLWERKVDGIWFSLILIDFDWFWVPRFWIKMKVKWPSTLPARRQTIIYSEGRPVSFPVMSLLCIDAASTGVSHCALSKHRNSKM